VSVADWGISGVSLAGEIVLEKARRERRGALILPREQGAWGLLLVPLVTGAGAGLRQGGENLRRH